MDDKIYRLDLEGYERYGITKSGKIYSFINNRFLRQDLSRGYASIALESTIEKKPIRFQVHRLVASQFIANPNNFPIVNHIDGNKKNNCVENLEWCTYKYNTQHAVKTGLLPSGFDSPITKLTKEKIFQIYQIYEKNKNIKSISRQFQVSDSTIHSIVKGLRWTDCYREYYKKDPKYKKRKRDLMPITTLKDILFDYYVKGLDTVQLEKKYNYNNSYIGNLVKGKSRPEDVRQCLQEIKKVLDNQQPNLVVK